MLFYLFFYVLHPYWSPLNVFRYITVRTALASLTALFLSMVLGPWVIRRLRAMRIGQYIREEGPKSHQTKAGKPTMGGVRIVTAIVVLIAAIPVLWLVSLSFKDPSTITDGSSAPAM